MKNGKTLNELAAELTRQMESKKDYIADTRALRLEPAEQGGVTLQGVNGGLALRPIAHRQLAATLGIPATYYDRMLAEAPELLATNANTWFGRQPAKRLVRTLDGACRAFLSDSYRPLDNYELTNAVLPKLVELGASIVSCEVTEGRFYLKAVTDKIAGEVKQGDVIQAGLVVSNSEVGQGSLRVEALDFRLVCTNGMVREAAIRKAHLGRGARGLDAIEDAREFFRDETRAADDRAFFLKVQDAVGSMFDSARFEKRLEQYREVSERKMEADPIRVVEATAKRLDLQEGEKTNVLRHLLTGGNLDAWGLANAITRASQDVADYDRATALESLGGRVVELTPTEWRQLAGSPA
jgi:hypothetical protein